MSLQSLRARLRRYVGNRRRALRRGARVAVQLPVAVAPLDAGQEMGTDLAREIMGCTRDLSGTGLTLLLPAVRVGARYLTDRGGYLGVRLALPDGPLCLLAAPVRFEQLPKSVEGYGFLLGARVVKMVESERARYMAYLGALVGTERRRAEQGRVSKGPADGWGLLTPNYIEEAFDRFAREHAHKS